MRNLSIAKLWQIVDAWQLRTRTTPLQSTFLLQSKYIYTCPWPVVDLVVKINNEGLRHGFWIQDPGSSMFSTLITLGVIQPPTLSWVLSPEAEVADLLRVLLILIYLENWWYTLAILHMISLFFHVCIELPQILLPKKILNNPWMDGFGIHVPCFSFMTLWAWKGW